MVARRGKRVRSHNPTHAVFANAFGLIHITHPDLSTLQNADCVHQCNSGHPRISFAEDWPKRVPDGRPAEAPRCLHTSFGKGIGHYSAALSVAW